MPATDTVQTTINSTAGTSILITKPSGVVNGDLMVAQIGLLGTTNTITGPSGWTEEETASFHGDRMSLWVKVAGASEPADYTWSWTGSSRNLGGIVRITGHDQITPIAASPTIATGSSNSPNPPSADPGSSDVHLSLAFAHIEAKNQTFTPPTSPGVYTEEWDIASTGGGAGTGHGAISIASREYTGQVEDPGVFTAANADGWGAATIIIAPAGAPAADIYPPFPRRHHRRVRM